MTPPVLLTTSEAARFFGVVPATVRKWAQLGYLDDHGSRGNQRLYEFRQLSEVERRTRLSRNQRRDRFTNPASRLHSATSRHTM